MDAGGTPERHEWITVEYRGADVDHEGTIDEEYVLVEKHFVPSA